MGGGTRAWRPAVDAEGRPWFADGLRFGCTRCGNCCGGAPGFVWISEDEIHALATRLGVDAATFRRRYTFEVPRRGVSLVEKGDRYECVFFERGKGCTVYEDRPRQCRTWPFWRSNLVDAGAWEAAGRGCPGINKGETVPEAAIAERVADDGLPR